MAESWEQLLWIDAREKSRLQVVVVVIRARMAASVVGCCKI